MSEPMGGLGFVAAATVVAAAAAACAATSVVAAGSPPPLTVPAWTWEPAAAQVASICLDVPDSTGNWNNLTIQWANNSRLLYLAVPDGPAPPTGWPVMVDLLVVDFASVVAGAKKCGTEGQRHSERYPPSLKCVAAVNRTCGASWNQGSYYTCQTNRHHCFYRNESINPALAAACTNEEISAESLTCPKPPKLSPLCRAALEPLCNWTKHLLSKTWRQNCSQCVAQAQQSLSANSTLGCPRNATATAADVHMVMETDFCVKPPRHKNGKGEMNRIEKAGGIRGYFPYASPQTLGMQCSCINGTTFNCSKPFDDDKHGHLFVPPGGYCDFDVFAGGLWSQRIKQFALNNGVAVLEVNNYVNDGWESWEQEWSGGYDPVFFRSLAAAINGTRSNTNGVSLGALDANRIAFRGYSGSAQMVSWLMNEAASGKLPGLNISAGIMMAGGSHGCYNTPGAGAINQCANCTVSHHGINTSFSTDPRALGCSNTARERGLAQPYCELCCPANYTEQWYSDHPEDYATHPPTFLIQTEMDSGADSCAALNYHETMKAHNGHSELAVVPLVEQRCYSTGHPADLAVPAADTFARFCSSPNMSSVNHTLGFAAAVEPLTRFLVDALQAAAPLTQSTLTRPTLVRL